MLTGKPLVKGHNSHISPCGQELVIFHPDQILPCYVVHYAYQTGYGATASPVAGLGVSLVGPAKAGAGFAGFSATVAMESTGVR